MSAQYFCWDWKEQAPVGAIVKAAGKIKNAKAYWVNAGGSDSYEVIVAANKKEALETWHEVNEWAKDEGVVPELQFAAD